MLLHLLQYCIFMKKKVPNIADVSFKQYCWLCCCILININNGASQNHYSLLYNNIIFCMICTVLPLFFFLHGYIISSSIRASLFGFIPVLFSESFQHIYNGRLSVESLDHLCNYACCVASRSPATLRENQTFFSYFCSGLLLVS